MNKLSKSEMANRIFNKLAQAKMDEATQTVPRIAPRFSGRPAEAARLLAEGVVMAALMPPDQQRIFGQIMCLWLDVIVRFVSKEDQKNVVAMVQKNRSVFGFIGMVFSTDPADEIRSFAMAKSLRNGEAQKLGEQMASMCLMADDFPQIKGMLVG